MQPGAIERVLSDVPHTLVVNDGAAEAHLAIIKEIPASQLLDWCADKMNWQVTDMPFVVDGERFEATQASEIALQPAAGRVDLGEATKISALEPTKVEFTRDLGSKG